MHQSVVEVGTNICGNVTEAPKGGFHFLEIRFQELAANQVVGWLQRVRTRFPDGKIRKSQMTLDTITL